MSEGQIDLSLGLDLPGPSLIVSPLQRVLDRGSRATGRISTFLGCLLAACGCQPGVMTMTSGICFIATLIPSARSWKRQFLAGCLARAAKTFAHDVG